jgi:methylated-DNA-[protein]-cysteine S-methyltransferase
MVSASAPTRAIDTRCWSSWGTRSPPSPRGRSSWTRTTYFAGTLTRFDIEYVPSGSAFQRQVWEALDAIPYGTTLTYGGIGARIGAPRSAARSVGTAIGANPLLVVRPCHRVIRANGSLTGYAGGMERKQLLLTIEGMALVL